MASENKSKVSILTNGIIKENPVLRLVLGTCSCLAVTTAVSSALGMGAAFTFVLVCSNILISLLRNVIPAKVHLPCYIVIIAGFVTIVQMVMHAYMESLYTALGVFLPLIVVNCIILGRPRPACPAIPPISEMCSANLWKKRAMSACSRRTAAATPMCRRCRRWAWTSRPSRAS